MKNTITIGLMLNVTICMSQYCVTGLNCYGGSNNEYAQSVELTQEGGFIIAGSARSSDQDVSGHLGGQDFWVLKLDIISNIQWKRCYGGTADENAFAVSQTTDGGYIAAGFTASNDGDITGNKGGQDGWVIKLTPAGDIEWQTCIGGSGDETFYSVLQLNDGGYILSGNTWSNNCDVTGNHGGSDGWVVKLSSSGNLQWQKCFGGSGNDYFRSIKKVSSGGFIIAGYTWSADGDISYNNGMQDLWLIRISENGIIEWSNCYGGTLKDQAFSVCETSDGEFVTAGCSNSSNGNLTTNNGLMDFWIVKVDQTGSLIWQKNLGGTEDEMAYSVIHTYDSCYIIAGRTFSVNGDVTGNNGSEDMWFVKLDMDGNILWKKCIGETGLDVAQSVVQTFDGGIAVAGFTWSVNGQMQGNHGASDMLFMTLRNPNIIGKLFHDYDGNGQLDPGELGIGGHILKGAPGPVYSVSEPDGTFEFSSMTNQMNISYVSTGYWYTTGPLIHQIQLDSIGQIHNGLLIGIKNRYDIHDVAVYVTGTPTRIGFDTYYYLFYSNIGTTVKSGDIYFVYDSCLTFLSSTFPYDTHIGDTLVFSYDSLGVGQTRSIMLTFRVPDISFLGDTINSYALITPLIPDTNITNNTDSLVQIITGSYDPNDKTARPAGIGPEGMTCYGERLSYTIRFQNTGTDTAFTVIIRDTLDVNLDIETLTIDAFSHPCSWEILSRNEMFFVFYNILLPDSHVNEPASHGYIRYSVSPHPNLPEGTAITNSAYIFFDYNPAIVTNTTLNTYYTKFPVAGMVPINNDHSLFVYPNPAKDFLRFDTKDIYEEVTVSNVSGKVLFHSDEPGLKMINVHHLPPGIYFLRVVYGDRMLTTKFVKTGE